MKIGIVKRSSRRFYVVLIGLSYVLMVSFWALANSLANDWLMLPTLLAALTFLYSFSRIFIGTQAWNVANRSAAEADERQRIVRDRAHFWAYLYASIFALLSLTYWYFAGELGWWLPRGYGERTATFWTLLLLIPSLPSAIIAWLEPDPVSDDPQTAEFKGESSMKKLVSPVGTLNLSRTVRRTLVTVMYGVYLGLIAYWSYLPGEMPDGQLATAQWLTLAGLVTFIVSYLVLNVSTQGLADRYRKTFTSQALDERQLLLRNQAYFWAYLSLGTAAFLLLISADKLGFGWTLIAFAGLYMSLPTALIAWLEPNPVKDVFEERTLA